MSDSPQGKHIKNRSNNNFLSSLSRKKPIEKSISETAAEKTLRWYDLTAYGIAATVGSGIYVACGYTAKTYAGPAVVLSTGIAGLLSLFTGICYLEFASSLPISGSGYAYFYTLMGEFLGWFVGWNLTLEYAFAAAAIAGGWTEYFVALFRDFGATVPEFLYNISFEATGGLFRLNFLAAAIVLLVGVVVSGGVKFGAVLTNVITALNIGLILFIIVVGSFSVDTSNWTPLIPTEYGWGGVFMGASNMFFSYIGYDTISSMAGDAINPGRDLPVSMLMTIGVATALYMAVGLVLTGMCNYTLLDEKAPLAKAFFEVGQPWAAKIVSFVALMTMAATLFACLMGQPKIFQTISRDGLLPKFFSQENSKGTPVMGVVFTTFLTALVALVFDVNKGLIGMITFGTLFGMSLLCSGLLIVRFRQHAPIRNLGISLTLMYFAGAVASSIVFLYSMVWSGIVAGLTMGIPLLAMVFLFLRHGNQLASTSTAFSCPLMPLIPCLAIAANTFMMFQDSDVWVSLMEFVIWTLLGFIIYFTYGIYHSQLSYDEEK